MAKINTPPAPMTDEGSGKFMQRLILGSHNYSDEELRDLVLQHYDNRKTTVADVAYNRGILRKTGELPGHGLKTSSSKVAKVSVSTKSQLTRKSSTVVAHADPDREFDRTSMTGASHGYRIHRDFAAHFFRWGFAHRFLNNKLTVLDVGCGTDCPLVKTLSGAYASSVPKRYVGVDLNKLDKKLDRKWVTFHDEFNFIKRYAELGTFDLVVNFEVIEHMQRTNGPKLLKGLRACLKPKGTLLLSTPIFDGKRAKNHLHEYTVDELAGIIKRAGLVVKSRYGTFANLRDIKKVADPVLLKALLGLNEFYSTDVTACFLAPLYPDASRNNVWVLKKER